MPGTIQPTGPIKIDKGALKVVQTTDSASILQAAKSYIEADVHITPGSVTYTLIQQQGAFARVSVHTNEGGGYAVTLKKVYGIWVALFSGQDKPGKDIGEKYGLPQGWFSEEY